VLDDILKNMALYVDGRGYAGNVEELTLPTLTLKTEEFRNGGMDAPVDVELGMEKLETEFTLTSFDRRVIALFGVTSGGLAAVTVRGVVASDNGVQTPVIVNLRGIVRTLDFGTWKPGDKAILKIMVSLRYYKLRHGVTTVHEIDIPNMVRVVDGVDQLAATRAALGL